MNRPHAAYWPAIHAARRISEYTLARWRNLRPAIRPTVRDALIAFGAASLAWLALALPFQHYAHADWEKRTGFRENVAALHARHSTFSIAQE